MATAHVAGAAALLMSHFPECTNNQIRNAMIKSTTKPPPSSTGAILEWDKRYGWGIVNVGKAHELLTEGCVIAGGVYPRASEVLSDQAGGGKLQVVIRESNATHHPTSSPVARTSPCARDDSCGATLETWTGIGGSTTYDLEYGTKSFTLVPSRSTRLTELLESPSDIDDNYGSRMWGWLKPPVTGAYTFWIASDDEGEFWLSTDSSSVNKVRVCYQPWSAESRDWTRFSEQKSRPISLVAGQAYYYEVRVCVMLFA